MKILVLNYEYPPLGGGAAPVCRDLATCMAKEGHQVSVVTMGFPGLPPYEINEGVEIYRVKCLRMQAHSCKPWEQASYILAAKWFLKKNLQIHSYDICHVHFVVPTGPIAKWLKAYMKIPYIITAHGSDVEGYNEKVFMKVLHWLLRPAWKRIVREAYAIAAPSEYLLNLLNREMPSDNYKLIPNGLDVGKYRAEHSQKEKRILLMGRMQKSKNFQTILKAVAMIPDKIWRDWHVDILGDGPYRKELELFCVRLGIISRVTFYGWIENGSSEQLECLKRSAIYISASHFENCPMAVLEAIAAGCCPLLSDIEGHRHFFQGEADKFFFGADDVKGLAGRLELLLSAEAESYSVEGLNITSYDNQQIIKRYLNLLEQAAKNE